MVYAWVGPGLVGSGDAPVCYAKPIASGTATYTFTATLGACTAASNPVDVTVVGASTVTATPNNDTICLGKQATFTASGATEYVWKINGLIVDGAVNAVFTYNFNEAGTFVVTVLAATDCGSDEVTAGTIVVKATPEVSIEGPTLICNAANPPTLQSVVTPWNAQVTYQWFEDGNPKGTNPTQTLNNTPRPEPYVYVVVITDPVTGCDFQSKPHHVYVEQFPKIAITAEPSEVCPGKKVVLTALVNSNPNMEYQWYMDGNEITGAITPIWNVYPTTTATYTFTAKEIGSGCFATSNPALVTVIPIPDITATLVIDTICQFEQVTFTATLTTNAPVTYTWLINGVEQNATESVFTHEFNYYGTFDVKVYATTVSAGCQSTTVNAGTIVVKAAPKVVIAGPHEVCDATVPTTLLAVVDPLNATVTYKWFEGPYQLGTDQTQPVNNIPSSYPYIYYVEITDIQSGCVVLSAPHEVYVTELGHISIPTPTNSQICFGESFSLSPEFYGNMTNINWQWYEDGIPLDGETNLELSFIPDVGNHLYWIVGTQEGSECSTTSNKIIIYVTPLPEKPTLTISPTMTCSGNPVTITGDLPGTYTWFENGLDINGSLQSITVQPTANNILTTYIYEAIVEINGCISKLSDPVNVSVHPEIGVVILGAQEVCEQALGGEQLVLHALTIGLQDGVEYQYDWYYLQGYNPQEMYFGGSTALPYVYVPNNWLPNDPAEPYYIYVKVTALGYDCTTTSAAHEVNILEKPTVGLTVDNPNICIGGTVIATAYPTPTPTPENPYNYRWFVNGNEITGINVNPIQITNGLFYGVNEITVIIERSYASASCFGTNSIFVNVLTPPSLVLTQDINGLQLPGMCVGGQVNLCATVVDFDETLIDINDFKYEWRVNNNSLPWLYNCASDVLTTPNTYNYEVRAYLTNGLACGTEWTPFVPVKVVEQPSVQIASKDFNYNDVCQGATVEIITILNITDPTIHSGYQFKWNDLPDWENFTNQIDPRTITFPNVGQHSYSIKVEFANPTCLPIKESNTLTYNVVNPPVWTNVSMKPNKDEFCKGETIELCAKFTGGVNDGSNIGLVKWFYSLNGDPYVDIQGPGECKDFTLNQVGAYTFKATYVPSQPGSGCQVDPYLLRPVDVIESVAPTAIYAYIDNNGIPQICGNDPYAGAITLPIVFEGNPPFEAVIKGTDGSVFNVYTIKKLYDEFKVSPTTTTTYTIESLIDKSKCVPEGAFVKSSITVIVTDIEVLNPNAIACANTVDINLSIKSTLISNIATVTFAGKTQYPVIQQMGSQSVITINIPAEVVNTGDYPVLIVIDGCEYPIVVTVGKPDLITAVFTNNPASPQICANDPAATSVDLFVHFEGTPPFKYLFVGTDGTSREITSFTIDDVITVTPQTTTTYSIEWMLDNSACAPTAFVKPEITVVVTDIEFVTTDVITCEQIVEIEFYVISALNLNATIKIGANTYLRPIVQGYNAITIDITGYGTYDASVTIDGCEFTFKVSSNFGATAGKQLIHKRWEGYYEVLVVSNNYTCGTPYYNGGYKFTSYQWYKNGVLIPGATQQYYQDPNGVNGIYSVRLTGTRVFDDNCNPISTPINVEFETCGEAFNAIFATKVYPVPAHINELIWVEIDLTPAELDGAYLDIYDAKGAHIKQIQVTDQKIQIDGFKTQGTYNGRITTGTNEIKAVRFVIVK
jgi:hypothetical protein